MSLYFISSNKSKIKDAQEELSKLDIQITPHELSIIEIQSDKIEEITHDKAEQAFKQLQEQLIITDHGWYIPGLNGFPGPYMKYMNEWLTPQDFLNLTKDLTDRKIIMKEVVCYKDATQTKIFTLDHTGILLTESRGTGDPIMTIASFLPGMSNAEARNKGLKPRDSSPLWNEFAKWYKQL